MAEQRVVSFLSEKEERRVAQGKTVVDPHAAARKRERKLRYKARREEQLEATRDPEAATSALLRELGGVRGGSVAAEEAIPEEFRSEFEALVDAYGPETDVPDIAGRHASKTKRRRRALEREKEEDSAAEKDAPDADAGKSAQAPAVDGADAFGDALAAIVGEDAAEEDETAAAAATTTLAGEEAATRRVREERAAKQAEFERAKVRRALRNKACVPLTTSGDALAEERKLRRTATRGVVQLFNAIAQAQAQHRKEDADQEPTTTTKKKTPAPAATAAQQSQFLSLLRRGSQGDPAVGATTLPPKPAASSGTAGKPAASGKWSALREDFMLGAKLRDWDAAHEGEGEEEEGEDAEMEDGN